MPFTAFAVLPNSETGDVPPARFNFTAAVEVVSVLPYSTTMATAGAGFSTKRRFALTGGVTNNSLVGRIRAVAENAATCPPMTPVALAGPAAGPSVQLVRVTPLSSVKDESGCTEPPWPAAQRTTAPGTGFPYWSVTRVTSGSATDARTPALCPSPETFDTIAGGPASAVELKTTGGAPSTFADTS